VVHLFCLVDEEDRIEGNKEASWVYVHNPRLNSYLELRVLDGVCI